MFLSVGNPSHKADAGLLLISFERPHRVRLQATASVDREDPLRAACPQADSVVRATQIDAPDGMLPAHDAARVRQAGTLGIEG